MVLLLIVFVTDKSFSGCFYGFLIYTLRDTLMSVLYFYHILYVLSETPDAVDSYTQGIMLMRCLSLSHNAPQKQHIMSAVYRFMLSSLLCLFCITIMNGFFSHLLVLFSLFMDIKWSCIGVSQSSEVLLVTIHYTHHKVASSVPGRHQAGRGTRVLSRTGRRVIGLQWLNEISS